MVGFINEVPEDDAMTINTDPTLAGKTVLVRYPGLLRFRDEMNDYKCDSAQQCDRLEALALAMIHVDSKRLSVIKQKSAAEHALARGLVLRELMTDSIELAVKSGAIGDPLDALTRTAGYTNVARDLKLQHTIFVDHQAALSGKTVITEELLSEALAISDTLFRFDRANDPKKDEELKLLRERTFTRLYQAWESVRRTVQHIRYAKGDADVIAPNLFAQDTTAKHKKEVPPEPEPAAPPANDAPTTPSSGTSTPTATPGFGSHDVPVGFPGSSPFIK
jgi:hypothetical protein